MNLPTGLVEWFYVPGAGERGIIASWRTTYGDKYGESHQIPGLLVAGETLRVCTSHAVTRLVGRGDLHQGDKWVKWVFEFKRISEAVTP